MRYGSASIKVIYDDIKLKSSLNILSDFTKKIAFKLKDYSKKYFLLIPKNKQNIIENLT